MPVIERASSDARNRAALAVSSGSGMRPSGMVARKRWRASSMSAAMPGRNFASIGVSVTVGQMALTRMLAGASSSARLRTSPTMPCLATV